MELLFFRDPKTKSCGKKRVAEWFGLRNADLTYKTYLNLISWQSDLALLGPLQGPSSLTMLLATATREAFMKFFLTFWSDRST